MLKEAIAFAAWWRTAQIYVVKRSVRSLPPTIPLMKGRQKARKKKFAHILSVIVGTSLFKRFSMKILSKTKAVDLHRTRFV